MAITGRYIIGCGKAHLADSVHISFFDYPMFGTFNVQTQKNIEQFRPIFVSPEGCYRYWHIRIDDKYDAWAWRRSGSQMSGTIWELVSKELLPDILKRKTISLVVMEA
jgi:hypothetical protein